MITSDLILSLLEILAAAWILGFIFSRFGLSITAIAVQAVVLQAMKINRTALGHIIIGAAIADDILALIALSTLLGLAKTGTIDLVGVATILSKDVSSRGESGLLRIVGWKERPLTKSVLSIS